MFGYVNVNQAELTEENRHCYQAYYCGLCRSLKKKYGRRGQILLNYDMTFLIVLLAGLYEPKEDTKKFVCTIHPLQKREAVENEISSYAADMNVMLAYHNLVDDWKDEKKITQKTMANMLRKDYEQIKQLYPRQAKAIESYMLQLEHCETEGETNIDVVAGLTGEMLGELFAWKQDEWYDELKTLGLYLGKFIYLMDAYEDIKRDEKKGRYNPLITLKQDASEDFEVICKLMMTSMMSECAKSFERLPILYHADILRNILYSGVWTKYEYIQLKNKRKSVDNKS